MTELYDGLMTTRAMRRFTDEPVTDEEVERMPRGRGAGAERRQHPAVPVPRRHRRRAAGGDRRDLPAGLRPLRAGRARAVPADRGPDERRRHERNWAMSAATSPETIGSAPVHGPRARAADLDGGARRRRRDGRRVRPTPACTRPCRTSCWPPGRWGLGTCLTTVYRIHEAEVRAVCDIPDRYEVVALLPLGRPTGRWGVAPRRPAPLPHELEHLRQQAPLSCPGSVRRRR